MLACHIATVVTHQDSYALSVAVRNIASHPFKIASPALQLPEQIPLTSEFICLQGTHCAVQVVAQSRKRSDHVSRSTGACPPPQEEDTSDYALAWENLEVAKLILGRDPDKYPLELAGAHSATGQGKWTEQRHA